MEEKDAPGECTRYDGHRLLEYHWGLASEDEEIERHIGHCVDCFSRYWLVIRDQSSTIPASPEEEETIDTPRSLPIARSEPESKAAERSQAQPSEGSNPVIASDKGKQAKVKRRGPISAIAAGACAGVLLCFLTLVTIGPPPFTSATPAPQQSTIPIEQIREWMKKREYAQVESALPALLKMAQQTNNKAMESELKYFEGRILSNRAAFDQAIEALTKSRQLAIEAKRPDLELAPLIPLSNIYHTLDNNPQARDTAREVAARAKAQGRIMEQIAGLQMLGLSDFLLRRAPDAEAPILESLQLLAEQPESLQKQLYAAQAHNYLGVIRTEQKRFKEATALFEKALTIARTIAEPRQRAKMQMAASGYYARSQAIAGNHIGAAKLYRNALAFAAQSNSQQHLLLSQLRYGLYECFKIQGKRRQAREELARAQTEEAEAIKMCERGNIFLSFAIDRVPAAECKK